VRQLQQQALGTWDLYTLDRLDRALNELVRNSEKTTPAAFQRRSAMANASKVLRDRVRIAPIVSLDLLLDVGEDIYSSDSGSQRAAPDILDIHIWLETTPALTSGQRAILQALASGEDAVSLAHRHHVPVERMRERISRARKVGWTAYLREVGHA
jgi:hypothetical protein